jgi:heme/copper-type cytochrome/quinol oxidase subunit 2
MADRKIVTASQPLKKETQASKKSMLPLFERENYMWMIIGGVIIAIGMLLMAGGKNSDANQFDYNVVYSTTRITIAPILILIGLAIEIYAIFKRPKAHHQ